MTKNENLHELTRDALAHVRLTFPDATVDVEHRGDGECEVDGPAVATAIAAVLAAGIAVLDEGESLWMRSSGLDASALTVEVRWRGGEPDATTWSAISTACSAIESLAEGRERRVRLRFRRSE